MRLPRGNTEMARYVSRDEITGVPSFRSPFLNNGETEDAGADLSAAASFKTGPVRWSLGSQLPWKLYSKDIEYPGGPRTDSIGDNGKPRWRAVNTLGSNLYRCHNVLLTRYLAGIEQNF